jgi:branched-chain amino acid transport system ATP-binding protein
VLALRNVHSGYGGIRVLEGISIEVKTGEMVSLLGANASGKSTTLKTIMGYVRPTQGSIALDGQRIDHLRTDQIVRRGITMVPENRRVFPQLTVHENLLMGAYLRNDKRAVLDDIERNLQLFPRLKERTGSAAGTLSGGEQQMLAMARALMSDPKVITMDEPSMGLSPVLVKLVYETIQRIREERRISMLIVEQNVGMALQITDRAYVLEKGKIAITDSSKSLYQSERVRQYYLGKLSGR